MRLVHGNNPFILIHNLQSLDVTTLLQGIFLDIESLEHVGEDWPQQEIDNKMYSDRLTYHEKIQNSEKKVFLIIGEDNSFERRRAEEAIDLKVVTSDNHASTYFYYKGERVSLFHRAKVDLHYYQGFIVTKKGIATPFFTNNKEKNDIIISARSMRTGAVYKVNARDIEFRSSMDTIEVSTGK